MSYGNSNYMYGSDMKHIQLAKIQKLMDTKQCPRLKNKPKLVFYQACRVRKYLIQIIFITSMYDA